MSKNSGIPVEVSIYHPIEFLELDKPSMAYLDLGLEDMKGGIGHQLLVGHLVSFIENNGIEGLEKLPRYNPNFVTNITKACMGKGLDIKQIEQGKYKLNWDKMSKLSDTVSIYHSEDPFDRAANIYASSNYSMFHPLPFNRKKSPKHVNEIVASIKENGVLSYPLMIYTNCIDGEYKYWIIDGQHRFAAFQKMGLPIRFTLYQKQEEGDITIYDIVRLVARVNNTSLKWNIHQYLKAWKSINVPEYIKIDEVYKATKIAINVILQAYSGYSRKKATSLFMNGTFEMNDREYGEHYIEYLMDLLPIIPKKSSAYQAALLDLFRKEENYDNKLMMNNLLKVKNSYVFAETQEAILGNLQNIYKMTG